MVDGAYHLTLQTPAGPIQARLTLKSNGGELSGKISAGKGSYPFSGGWVQGSSCGFESNVQTLLGVMFIRVRATVENDLFKGTAQTSLGTIQAQGKRIKPVSGNTL